MPITPRTSIATPTANSYVSVASANSYFEFRYNADAWEKITSATNSTAASNLKGELLIQATREIDRTYRFVGSKYNQGIKGDDDYQNLEMPRFHHTLANGDPYIIDEVKFATYEQALWILERTNNRRTEDGNIVNRSIIGKESYMYLQPVVLRTVKRIGRYPWMGSTY